MSPRTEQVSIRAKLGLTPQMDVRPYAYGNTFKRTVTILIGLMNEKSDKLHVKLGEGKRSMKLAYRQNAVELAFAITVWKSHGGTYPNILMLLEGSTDAPKWCYKHMYVAYSRVPSALRFRCFPCRKRLLACSERASLPMLPLSQAFRRKPSVATYSPTCANIWATKWRMDAYGRMATGGRNNLCWTNHEAARNHHRHHERGNKRP